jgi:citrate lyase subunit gamma (acyl carrier protein)
VNITKTAVAGTLESSDVMITVEPNSAELVIDLQSIVEKQFGREIRRVIAETLAELGVTQGKITAVDKGALDCAIRARVKTAVCRSAGEDVRYQWKV